MIAFGNGPKRFGPYYVFVPCTKTIGALGESFSNPGDAKKCLWHGALEIACAFGVTKLAPSGDTPILREFRGADQFAKSGLCS